MADSKEREVIAKSITSNLKRDLEQVGVKLVCFLDNFYLSSVNASACSSELHDHRERFKTSSKRNAEVAGLYSVYFNSKYLDSNCISKMDRDAAWELKVELSTRVSSVELINGIGCDKTALSSLHSLFDTWRLILRNKGVESLQFLNHSKVYFDDTLRPFTTKWHTALNDGAGQSESFRSELVTLQFETSRYCKKLEDDFLSRT